MKEGSEKRRRKRGRRWEGWEKEGEGIAKRKKSEESKSKEVPGGRMKE